MKKAVHDFFKSKVTKQLETIVRDGILLLNNKSKGFIRIHNNSVQVMNETLINFERYKSFGVCDSVAIEADILIRVHYASHIFDKKKSEQIIEVTLSKTSRVLFRKADGKNLDLPLNWIVKKAIENRIKSLILIK